MNPDLYLPLAASFVVGAVVAALVTLVVAGRQSQRRRFEIAQRLSAAEATAATERERRQELERELAEADTAARELDRELAVSRERVEQAGQLIEEQKAFVERSRKELEESFQALAGQVLKGSNEQFLQLAEQRLATERSKAGADLEERKKAIENLLGPLSETLGKLRAETQTIEKSRVEAYSRIDEQVRSLMEATSSLRDKTTSLESALKSSQVRGRWGELALRNVAELAGMTSHCDFEEQTGIGDGKRPDMIVNLPGSRKIAVDAKAPLTSYLAAVEAVDENARETALAGHVRDLKTHIRKLAGRDYADSVEGNVDLVVMFLPGDPFLSAAFAKDPDLQVEALRSKVLIATPTTLVALLRTVAIYWQQQTLAESAEAIAETARTLYERAAKFGSDLGAVGRGLKTALDAYNRAAASFEGRLMPMGRKLDQLKVAEHQSRELSAPDPIESEPRKLKE